MKRYFSKKVIDKIVIQIPKLPKKKFKKSKKEYFQILFLGSINNPGDFYQKGGGYAVDILEKLQKLYKIKLVIRCALPSEMQERILSNKDIIYYKNKVSQEKMEELYKTSDIAILANQYFVLMTTLEAKAYSLPIIALDTTPMVRELISKKDGFLIKPPEKLKKFYMMEKYPLDNRNPQFVKFLKCKDNRVVNDIANKIKSLMTKKHEKNR
ncbi:glycosyltransferase family 4 protein [Candidatus Pacearchaeota archaeon]|nr:glycosyltransferase family 4 protein [Candidatus Pacearchaeota archaeon]